MHEFLFLSCQRVNESSKGSTIVLVSDFKNILNISHSPSGYRIDETESDITSDQEKLMKKTQQLERVNSLLMKKMQMKSTSSAQYSSTYHLSTSSQHAPDWRE